MLATPQNIHTVAGELDHPEGLNFGPDGKLYAGGEAGQLYRIDAASGAVEHYATAAGFLMLGVTLDGNGNLYGCSVGRREVVRVTPDGRVESYSKGLAGKPLANPNYSVFDSAGNLYYSDSGSYFEPTGAIYVVRPGGRTELFAPGPLPFPNGLAIDPDEQHLYVALSTGPSVARLPLYGSGAPSIETVIELDHGVVPDGLAFTAGGRCVIACYVPDRILITNPGGGVEVLMEDPGAELMNRPTNVALADGRVYFANLGGWHIGSFAFEAKSMPLRYPKL